MKKEYYSPLSIFHAKVDPRDSDIYHIYSLRTNFRIGTLDCTNNMFKSVTTEDSIDGRDLADLSVLCVDISDEFEKTLGK